MWWLARWSVEREPPFSRKGANVRYVIIGNSAAGNAAACSIRSRDPSGSVLVLSDEAYAAYYRPVMPFFIDDRAGSLGIFQADASMPQDIEVQLGVRVEQIDREKKLLSIDDGERLPYDRLLIGTGASPILPSIPGVEGEGTYVLRCIADAVAIKEAARRSERVVIIGGGRVGTKAAMALNRRGLEVVVVEQSDRIVPIQFDIVAAGILTRALEAQGIRVLLNSTASRIERRQGKFQGVTLEYGSTIEADFVVLAVGVRPNSGLARDAGIDVDRGIVVDKRLRTSAADIYAAGDAVQAKDIVTGEDIVPASWTAAAEMGRVAGCNMVGDEQEYLGTLEVLNSFVLAAVPTVAVGLVQPPEGTGYQVLTKMRGDDYRKLVIKNGRLVGALMVGDIEGAGLCTSLIKRGDDISASFLEELIAGRNVHASWFAQVRPTHSA